MGRLRVGFCTKQKSKLESIRRGQRKRRDLRSITHDHSYATIQLQTAGSNPDISNVTHEEVVDESGANLTPTDDWRTGRRVVELGVLADQLSQCKKCGLPLSLSNTVEIKTYGLSSMIKVLCVNTTCNHINLLPTGKKTNQAWDVNKKLALGFLILICVSASVILVNRISFKNPNISLPYKTYVASNMKTSKYVNGHISSPLKKYVASNGTHAFKYVNRHISSPYKKYVALNGTQAFKYVNRNISSPHKKIIALNGTLTSKYENEPISSSYKKYLGSNGNQLFEYVNGHPPTLYKKHGGSNGTKSSKYVNGQIASPYQKYVESNGARYVNENQVLRQPNVMNTGSESTNLLNFTWKQTTKGVKPGIICPMGIDRLGNQIFQFASAFGIAMTKNMSLVIDRNKMVNRIFNLKVRKMNDNYFCDKLELLKEKFPEKYDSDLLRLNSSKSFRIGMYLESWKYFYNFTTELKKQLVFRPHIQAFVNNTIKGILQNFNVKSTRDVTLVGVHVRRGDKLRLRSYNVATPEYLQRSVSYFKTKYDNVIFIVASDDMTCTKANMPDKIKVASIHGRPEIDMATLASCDHVIITVGIFGWWSGWLAGGEVTYFKWPVKPGSRFFKMVKYEDFFYPGWIGM